MQPTHKSVLIEEVMEALAVEPSDTVVDATVGGAGHFTRLLAELREGGTLIGIDADSEAVMRAKEAVAHDTRGKLPTVHLVNDNFRTIKAILSNLGITKIDKALFDLGWSGYQLAAPRGFSFEKDEPLLMTYNKEGQAAAEIVNSASEEELADLIYAYGEERFARSIARAIIARRAKGRILSTQDLVAAVAVGTPSWYQHRKIHPATKTFQAFRIAVNDELDALKQGLSETIEHLSPGGKLAVISFHSIEDRIVKNFFRDASYKGVGLTLKKPIVPSAAEVSENRRARSAKLRIFEKNTARMSSHANNHLAYA